MLFEWARNLGYWYVWDAQFVFYHAFMGKNMEATKKIIDIVLTNFSDDEIDQEIVDTCLETIVKKGHSNALTWFIRKYGEPSRAKILEMSKVAFDCGDWQKLNQLVAIKLKSRL